MSRNGGYLSNFKLRYKGNTTDSSKNWTQRRSSAREVRSQSLDSLKIQHPSWTALFTFTTSRDLLILFPAILCSLCSGTIVTVNSYLLGKLFGYFTDFSAGSMSKAEFKNKIATYNIYIVIIATGSWIFNALAFFLWHAFGEVQAKGARVRIFNAMLTRKIKWFDRQKDGTAALTTRLLRYTYSSP
jgi:ABC-type multidrug transport system fused ATPase/permease subunit